MLYRNPAVRPMYSAHLDALMKSETVSLPALSGRIEQMYTIDDQCRIELLRREDAEDCGLRKWIYAVTMPVMCITSSRAARCEVHVEAGLDTPFSEEKMRFGCQLQADCTVFPKCACEVDTGLYRLTYDAHISLYATCLTGCFSPCYTQAVN